MTTRGYTGLTNLEVKKLKVTESIDPAGLAVTGDNGTITLTGTPTGDRTLTLPDATDTLVGKATTDTLTNKTLTSPKINEDVALAATATQLNRCAVRSKMYDLGTPVVADVDRLVTSTNMINGAYTIDGDQPDVPRNITVTVTAGNTPDTMGTITVVGKDYADADIEEVITPVAGSTVAGKLAFKSVTSLTGAGWAIDGEEGTNDTIEIGVGNELGMHVSLADTDYMVLGMLDTTIVAHNPTVADPATLAGTTVDMSAGTYDGSKHVKVLVVN